MLHAREPLVVASPGLVSLDPPQLAKPGEVVQRRSCPGMERSDHLFVSGRVQARWCRPWMSPRHSMRTLGAEVARGALGRRLVGGSWPEVTTFSCAGPPGGRSGTESS